MKRVYTILSLAGKEAKNVERIFKELGINRKYWDKSKVFKLNGVILRNYTVVTNEETFNIIVEKIKGTRVY